LWPLGFDVQAKACKKAPKELDACQLRSVRSRLILFLPSLPAGAAWVVEVATFLRNVQKT
jgi:hypothetical protein